MSIPSFVPIVQHFPNRGLRDVTGTVREELRASGIGEKLAQGARVAIGVGSRGVANLQEVVRATVAHFQERGFQPFLVPAMGSHGGGTAAGQTDVLAKYGVTETTAGCAIESSIETVSLGRTEEGIETFFDRNAFASDGVFLINRIKWHTTFEAPFESGLFKMAGIGLGKVAGATAYHQRAVRMGLGPVIASVGRHVFASGKMLGGLGLVEDAHHETGKIAAIPAALMEQEEAKLLELARSWMARILFDEVDVLIVDEIGKQFSGPGMDSKIVNRHPYGTANPWPWAPRIMRIYLRGLSPHSYGNAIGIGMADLISQRLYDAIDWQVTRVNAFAASNLAVVRTPLRVPNDREAFEILANVAGRENPADVTYVRIENTLALTNIHVSENMLGAKRDDMEVSGPAVAVRFDDEGNLI